MDYGCIRTPEEKGRQCQLEKLQEHFMQKLILCWALKMDVVSRSEEKERELEVEKREG